MLTNNKKQKNKKSKKSDHDAPQPDIVMSGNNERLEMGVVCAKDT
jgi:hypothetical protein